MRSRQIGLASTFQSVDFVAQEHNEISWCMARRDAAARDDEHLRIQRDLLQPATVGLGVLNYQVPDAFEAIISSRSKD